MPDFTDAGEFARKVNGKVQFLALVFSLGLEKLKFQIWLNSDE